MPSNNSHKYFLLVDQDIIEFPPILGFKEMTSFKSLSFFTGLFDDKQDLIIGLANLGLIRPDSRNHQISIVKKTGNRKSGYSYKKLKDHILYKNAARYLSNKSVEEFLFENRMHRDIIKNFFKTYIDDLEQLIDIFEKKIEELESFALNIPYDKRTEIYKIIESKTNSLVNFKISLSNLVELLNIVSLMGPSYDRKLDLEYQSRIGYFVDSETHYIKGSKRTKNYRGIVKLACRIQEFLTIHEELKAPSKDRTYIADKIIMLDTYKKALEINRELMSTNAKPDDINEEDSIDPDSFMYVNDEDFQRLITPTTGDNLKESIEVDRKANEDKRNRL